jgi:hypothetical protein
LLWQLETVVCRIKLRKPDDNVTDVYWIKTEKTSLFGDVLLLAYGPEVFM